MTIIDFILIFILAFATAAGFFFGLIRVVGAIVTIVVSIVIAGLLSSYLAPILQPYLLSNPNLSKVAAFGLIYWLSALFLNFAVQIVNKLFNLPLLKTVNRLGGGLVSLLCSVIILSIIFYLINTFSWVPAIPELLGQSTVVPYLLIIGKYVSWLIPGL
jgi:membrane protein required for colicin V production